MLNDTSLKVIKQLLDKYGRPIWVPGLAVNAPDTILGYVHGKLSTLAPGDRILYRPDYSDKATCLHLP
jgi:hypothetical protein